jgi:hypothetical protein
LPRDDLVTPYARRGHSASILTALDAARVARAQVAQANIAVAASQPDEQDVI